MKRVSGPTYALKKYIGEICNSLPTSHSLPSIDKPQFLKGEI